MTSPILQIKNLKMHFPIPSKGLFKAPQMLKAVDGVSLDILPGETLGLVGESGCGKSSLGRTIIRLYDPTSGTISFNGKDIAGLSQQQLLPIRRDIQMIFQDPYASLNPRMTVFSLLSEPIKTHFSQLSKQEVMEKVCELMEQVGLATRFLKKYPHEFSGGQRQRIAIARALALDPKLIICDEPVSALDVSIQAQILNLLSDLQKQRNIAYLFIAHDLATVKHISHRIAVMYLGHIVEVTTRQELFSNPKHPYTQALLSAIPLPDPIAERKKKRVLLTGDLPSPIHPPKGCPFSTRCPIATPECTQEKPILKGDKHKVACLKV